MALKSGFFDSLNGDRKYNSVQMSQLFDGIINDGVFQNIGGALFVHENEGLNVTVASGRAWFNHTWTYNDSEYDVTLDPSNVVYPRIDTIALKIDSSLETRENSIVVLKGTPASEPAAPEYIDTEEIHYHPLADIYIGAGVTEVVQANITNRVGTSATPFVTGILETVNIDELVAQWQAQFTSWNSQKQTEFETWESGVQSDFEDWKDSSEDSFDNWFEHLHNELDANQAANLQRQIDENKELLTGVIESGNTDLTITDSRIHTTSIVDIYFENKILAPTSITVDEGEITLQIDPQETDTNVGVRVLNPPTA